MNRLFAFRSLFLGAAASIALLAVGPGQVRAVTLSWSTVGDAGNAADPTTGLGSVGYAYAINTNDITLGQYAAFLNAVAASDPYGLYSPGLGTDFPNGYFVNLGITQSGTPGHFMYATFGNANVPAYDVTWGDAARFANWLQNGQPTNLGEAAGSTETGAYTLNGATDAMTLMGIARNGSARFAIPNADEWYKSAYYKGGGTAAGYWLYATQSNMLPSNVLTATGTNNANFLDPGFCDPGMYLTPVGEFADSPGPYGTFDMNGDVFQWTEAIISSTTRGIRGASWGSTDAGLPSSFNVGNDPTTQVPTEGFRLVMLPVPEPDTVQLLLIGAGGLFAGTRRR